jgi:diadenosine tetraphosphatase ApaH/serine/threonine PP2A family protein phosphatase
MAERLAIISDIHANLEALEAVLADIDARGASEILCLGDVVGYGVDAEACVDLVRKRCSLCLCGNHDWALVNTMVGFNPMARRALEYTRERMEPGRLAGRKRRERWEFIKNLPTTHPRGDWLLVHGSPRDPVMEYIFPEDVDIAPEKMSEIFGKFEKVCFVGHTHLPGVFTDDMRFQTPAELGHSFLLGGRKAVVNVSSVGQPRDGDVRACYVQVSEGLVIYRRIEYDIQKTMEKIRASGIDALCAERLALGK